MKIFKKYNSIVIKIGSSVLYDHLKNRINTQWINSLIKEIKDLTKSNKKVVIVSSGSIALGKDSIFKKKEDLKFEDKKVAAAVGQIKLINTWQKNLLKYNMTAAQLLLTLNDSEDRQRYLNTKQTINSLLKMNIIPIINENETLSTTDLKFGDNDRLAARIAQMISAELLIMLSETDGIYEKNPKKNPGAKKINKVKKINYKIETAADNKSSKLGSGGMVTKIRAAKICMTFGCSMIISDGLKKYPLNNINYSNSSWFLAKKNQKSAKKLWIINQLKPAGKIHIDNGASKAIKNNKSLLPAGILKIEGNFEKGDAVEIHNKNAKKIAVGLSNYNKNDVTRIMGKKSKQIKKILGYSGRDEFIHKNDLVIL